MPPPVIDYAKLSWLCKNEGLQQRLDGDTTEEAHAHFMDHYCEMFVDASNQVGLPEIEAPTEKADNVKEHASQPDCCTKKHSPNRESLNHDIKFHMAKLHRERKIVDPDILFNNRIKELKTLIKKMPYERTVDDTKQIFTHLKTFEDLSKQVSDEQLRELCTAVQQDIWRDEGYTVFANTGFFIILRGSVTPITCPWSKVRGQHLQSSINPKSSTEEDETLSAIELSVGDCFGTLERVDGPEPNSRVLCVQTKSVPCEFLKIHSNDFKRITDHIQENEMAEKISLIQSCRAYKLWPRQSLQKIAELLEWTKYPQNTVLVSEGFHCPYIVFVKSGDCHVLKEVQVNVRLRNSQKKWTQKQVVVGQISTSESFGEVSALKSEPITSSVVTATQVEVGIITLERLQELDETTRVLLLQSNEAFYKTMTEGQIHDEYISQGPKRQWGRYKQDIKLVRKSTSVRILQQAKR